MRIAYVFLALFCLPGALRAQLLQQTFTTSVTLDDYIGALPNNGQWDGIQTSNAALLPVSIVGNALRFDKMGEAVAHVVRNTDFAPIPLSVMYRFLLSVSGNTSAQLTAGNIQIGSNFVTGSFVPQAIANVHSRFGINFAATPGSFSLRDIQGDNNSAEFAGPQVILWVVNNSGTALAYRSPAGTEELLDNDRWDLWAGTTKVFNDVNDATTTNDLTDINFIYSDGVGIMDFDNFLIDPIPAVPVSATATSVTKTEFTANWTPVAGNTGYRIDVATDAAFTNILPAYNNAYINGSSSNSFLVTGLTAANPAPVYYYRVRAASQYTVDEFQGASSVTQTVTLQALPLTLIDFSVRENDNDMPELRWTTTAETNIKHFIIQKSNNGFAFDSLGTVNPVNNPATTQVYKYVDNNGTYSTSFYRLKIVDIDMRYRLSDIVSLDNVVTQIRLLQNPISRNTVQIVHPRLPANAKATIYDLSGRLLKWVNLSVAAGISSVEVENLVAGIHLIKIEGEGMKPVTLFFIKENR